MTTGTNFRRGDCDSNAFVTKRVGVKVADWQRLLLTRETKKGTELRPVAANAITVLTHDPAWDGVVAYDDFAESIVTRRAPPWRPQDAPPDCTPGDWTDEDTIRVQSWLADAYGLDIGLEATLNAVKVAAARSRFHPVRDWLNSLRWDGQRRVRGWLHTIMGCDDTPYTREVGLSFLVSAVARVMVPGCKVDTMPILEGEQGTFKSSVIRALAGDDWFLEMSVTDISNKDAMQVLRRKWIAEFPEFDGFSVAEASHVKGYCSRQVDTYRPSYGKGSRDFPRQTVFAGSTNKTDYLRDETGARRFLPVQCRLGNVTLARELRSQLWAEAVALYQSDVPWHVVDPELLDAFKAEQAARYRSHPWEEKIASWLNKPIDLPLLTKRADVGVTTADVLEGACKVDVSKHTDADAKIAAACLRRLGWMQGPLKRDPRRGGARVRLFFPTPADAPIPEEATSGVMEIGRPPPGWPTDEELAALSGE